MLSRVEGTKESDKALQDILNKHGVSRNIGTTEIVTDKIEADDILGYWEIFTPDANGKEKGLDESIEWVSLKDADSLDIPDLPQEDIERFLAFTRTGGSVKQSNVI